MSNKIASKRYALALFDTVKNEELDSLMADAQSLSTTIGKSEELASLLKSPLTKNEITKMIMSAFPDATLELNDTAGDSNHYSAKISSKIFNGKTKVEQHKLVYKALKGKMGGELHALALVTEEKNG